MKILRAYKTELDLNNLQVTACKKHAGAARWAYNWGLACKKQAYKAGERVPSAIGLHRELNVLKKNEIPWMYEVSKCAPQEALRNLDKAYANFFRRARLKKQGKHNDKVGFPKFKSRKRGYGSFRLTGSVRVYEDTVQLPRLGVLRLKESGYLPAESGTVHILSATVNERAGRWFVSLQVEKEIPDPKANGKLPVGVDLGINALAVASDGMVIENPRALEKKLVKIRRLNRSLSRKQKGSANRRKAADKLAKAHYRVACIRKDAIHQATSLLAKTKSAVVLEDLNVSGMLKNRRLSRAIADVGFFEFRRQLEYKGGWYGCEVIFANRFYPSSKTCSRCGTIKSELSLGERVFRCDVCGLEIDRDLNAAVNLEQLATASSAGSDACGESVRPESIWRRSLKQEPNTNLPMRRFE